MIKERRLANIKNILQNFKKGNFETPIDCDGFGEYYDILNDLESIRSNMLVLQNKENEIQEKNKTNLANITHDMKTPLALISGYAECLQCGMDDKDYLELILQKTAYLNELVLKIINTSRKEIEQLPNPKEKVKAKEYFVKEFSNYINLAETKKMKILLGSIPEVNIFISQKEYKSVIQNLVSNAIKYGKRNGKIRVNFAKKDNYLVVKVKNDGMGIPKDKLPYIFDKFYMVDKARTSANSGLGLFIVKDIIEKNGGTIRCKSKENSYAEFIFTIPIYHEVIENDKIRETLPKIEDKIGMAAMYKTTNKVSNVIKKVLLTIFCVIYLTFDVAVMLTLVSVLVGLWALDIFLALASFTTFIFMGISIANTALVPIILMYFGTSIFCLGFCFVLSTDLVRMTNKIVALIIAVAQHMLNITNRVYGGATR